MCRSAEKWESFGVSGPTKAGRGDPFPKLRAHQRGLCTGPWNVSRAHLGALVQTRHPFQVVVCRLESLPLVLEA